MDYKELREHPWAPLPRGGSGKQWIWPRRVGRKWNCCIKTFWFFNRDSGVSDDERLIYDYEKMIEHLINYENMDAEEAIDYISYNFSFPMAGDKKWPVIMYSF